MRNHYTPFQINIASKSAIGVESDGMELSPTIKPFWIFGILKFRMPSSWILPVSMGVLHTSSLNLLSSVTIKVSDLYVPKIKISESIPGLRIESTVQTIENKIKISHKYSFSNNITVLRIVITLHTLVHCRNIISKSSVPFLRGGI